MSLSIKLILKKAQAPLLKCEDTTMQIRGKEGCLALALLRD